MIKLDPHFSAVLLACEAICHITSILPSSDLVEDIKDLCHTQYNLFVHMLEGKHFGTDSLNKFMRVAQIMKEEAIKLKEQQESE